MNCEDFRLRLSEGTPPADAAAVEHLETCSNCRTLAHAEEEVRRNLAAVRHTAPEVPASLDRTVLAAYRSRLAEKKNIRLRIARPLVWSAVAASLIVATMLALAYRKAPARNNEAQKTPSAPVVESPRIPEQPRKEVAVARPPATPKAHARRHQRPSPETPVAVAERASNGFQNLMFCDPLSCPGPMQVIRIQVPAAAMNRVPAWRPTGGMVQADVAIGSDGVARAIRIVR